MRIEAAGGVLQRWCLRGRLIAIVHRARYDDWCLPKGKLEAGESHAQAALREVREETGFRAEIMGFLGTTTYPYDDRVKTVQYFRMRSAGRVQEHDAQEVKETVWLSRREALARLTYADQKRIVAMTTKNWISRPFAELLYGFRPRKERLRSTIAEFESELKRNAMSNEDATALPWLVIAQELVEKAKSAADRGRLEEGWKCFLGASRMEIFGLKDNEKSARVLALRAEAAHKLSNWRRQAIEKILKSERDEKLVKKVPGDRAVTDPDATIKEATENEDLADKLAQDLDENDREPSVSGERLYFATKLRDEASNNKYFQSSYYRNQLVWLLLVMALALSLFLGLAKPDWFDSENSILTVAAQPVGDVAAPEDQPVQQSEIQERESDTESPNNAQGQQGPSSADLETEKEQSDPENPSQNPVSLSADDDEAQQQESDSTDSSQDGRTRSLGDSEAQSEKRGSSSPPQQLNTWTLDKRYMFGIVLLGIMGGAFSAILSLSPAGAERQIPAQIVDSYVTVFRPALGAVGALVVYAFIVSGIINFTSFSAPAALAVAFVAGFSERLVLRGVETVSGGEQQKDGESK